MPIALEQQLKGNVNGGNILSTYFIFGEDTYLKKLYVDKIIDKTVDRADDFNFLRFEGECSLQQVYDAKEQFPMMSDKKCVLLTDYDFEEASKSDFERLVLLLSEPNDTTVFVYWCNNVDVDTKRSTRFKELVKAVELAGGIAAELNHRSSGELIKVLQDGAKKRGTQFSSGAAAYLIESCTEDINVLLSELEKLCAYANGGLITREMIDTVCVKSIDASVYALTAEIIAQNSASALKLLDSLYSMRVEPMIILHTISSNFIDIYRAMAGLNAGVSINFLAEQFDYNNRQFVLEKASHQARKFTVNSMKFCLNALVDADKRLKSFAVNDRVVLEELIIRLIYIISKGENLD